MSSTQRGRTTTSVEGIPSFDVVTDPTPGLALIYSRLHAHLPSAVPFAVPSVSLGRESDNTLSIPEAAVSRYHARFERRQDGRTWVVDAQSTNGTFVNGRRVREAALNLHDVVRIGDTLFRFVEHGIYGYGAYRIDGSIVRQARPFMHGVEKPLLTGRLPGGRHHRSRREGSAVQHLGGRHRRERHRQGAGGARDSPAERPQGRRFRPSTALRCPRI